MGNSCKTKKEKEKPKKHFGNEDRNATKNETPLKKEGPKKIENQTEKKETEEINKMEINKIEIKKVTKKEEKIKIEEKKEVIKEVKKEEKKVEKKEEAKKEEKKMENEIKIYDIKSIKEDESLDVDNFSNEELTCNLRLEITLKKLPNDRNYSVELYEYNNSRKPKKKKIGETESKSVGNDKNVKFENPIRIPFHFSQIQPLEFSVKNSQNKYKNLIKITLGDIVGSLNQTDRDNLDGDSTFEVKAILDDELDKKCSFKIQVTGSLVGMKIGYTITSLGNQYEPINKLLYESELLENNSIINFNEIDIPINELASDENLEDNIVEIIIKDIKHSEELAKFSSNIVQLFKNENIIDLSGDKKATITCTKKNFHSLLDYLEGELHLASTLFIDFSEISEPNTHHSVNNETLFEKLMNDYINILVPYNEDQFFYIYGFGFDPKDKLVDYDPNMCPINKKIDSPAISKEDIKQMYDGFLSSIKFSKKKTDLSLIIKKFNSKIKEDIDDYDISEYNILLLFTNNDITNQQEFANDLILSSTLPMSVVIVGLGKGPFTNLETIENNFLNLTDNEGKKAKRKCIKFISFNKNLNNFQRTVRDSLINIPNEMIEFLSLNNIEPKS